MPARDERRVRFAEEDFHYTYPATPSPTYSDMSLPSSPGVMTPPPIPTTPFSMPPTPYPFQARSLPPTPGQGTCILPSAPATTIHPALARRSGITFDLRADPLMTKPRPALTPQQLAEPATLPKLPQLTLKCRALPWAIIIRPASSKPEAFVTVADVISGTYRQMCEAVKVQEFERIPSIDDRNRVRDAWQRRCHEVRGARDVERRVDFLMDETRFKGLSTTEEAPYVLRLSVSST